MINLLQAAHAFDLWLQKHENLSEAQFRLLHAIAKTERPTMGNVGEALQAACSTMTDLVDRLERQGRIERVRDIQDRRVIFLRITDPAWFDRVNKMVDLTFGTDSGYLSACAANMETIVPVYPQAG